MAKRDEPIDRTLVGPWREDDVALRRWSLRTGGRQHEIWASEETGRALLALIASLAASTDQLASERNALDVRVDELTSERDDLVRKHHAAAPSAKASKGGSSTSLESVPLAMIGTFRVDDPRIKAAAKKDPLMALAVQVAKATAPDASELDQARMRAMATAVSRGDLDAFWASSAERSQKKLAERSSKKLSER
jgi:hypothetical protein